MEGFVILWKDQRYISASWLHSPSPFFLPIWCQSLSPVSDVPTSPSKVHRETNDGLSSTTHCASICIRKLHICVVLGGEYLFVWICLAPQQDTQ